MDDLTREIKELALRAGADLVGIAPAEGWDAPKGHNPTDLMPNAKSVVVLGIRLLDWILDHGPPRARVFHHMYVINMLERVAFEVGRRLADKGFDAYPVDEFVGYESEMGALSQSMRSMEWFKTFEKDPNYKLFLHGEIPFVLAGYKAGLGVIGKSGLLITPQFGPRANLGVIITSAPLKPDKPIEANFCKGCYVCVKTCLGQAISDQGIDAAKCWRADFEHGESVAGVNFRPCPGPCRRNCPVGKLKTRYRVT
jgi:epoxyqueuosine reductase